MKRKIAALSVLVLALSILPAGASTFLAMSEVELVAHSSTVVQGRVVSVDSYWNDDHTVIVTEAVVEVEKTVVGHSPRFVTLRTAGGTVGDYTIVAHGFPTFKEGERSLLFLGNRTDEAFRVTGYQLGHYRIHTNRLGVEVAVPTVDPNVRLLSADGRAVERPRARPLASFEASLQEQGRRLQMTEDLR
jgi:hypothetical protein